MTKSVHSYIKQLFDLLGLARNQEHIPNLRRPQRRAAKKQAKVLINNEMLVRSGRGLCTNFVPFRLLLASACSSVQGKSSVKQRDKFVHLWGVNSPPDVYTLWPIDFTVFWTEWRQLIDVLYLSSLCRPSANGSLTSIPGTKLCCRRGRLCPLPMRQICTPLRA